MSKGQRAPIRVGVAGWDYRDWKGVVYPQPRPRGFDPLRYLARYIDVMEINSTFYGPARGAVAEKWVKRVETAESFRFAAKLWRRFTHERTTAWTRAEEKEVREGFDVLHASGRLNAVLLQFPWSYRNTPESLDWLEDLTGTFASYPLVVEVRHESWNTPEFLQWLAARQLGFVNLDQPLFRRSIRPSAHATAPIGYIRVHGRNYSDWFRKNAGRDARYNYLYEPAELKAWLTRARQTADRKVAEEVDVVFNNHYRGQAVVNALQFRKLVEGAVQPAPPPLVEAYPDALKGYARAAPVDAVA